MDSQSQSLESILRAPNTAARHEGTGRTSDSFYVERIDDTTYRILFHNCLPVPRGKGSLAKIQQILARIDISVETGWYSAIYPVKVG